jgi:hypothetical protein
MVKPIVTCGSEIGATIGVDMNRMFTWERKILRRIYGQVTEQGMWRIRNNQELTELHNVLDIMI